MRKIISLLIVLAITLSIGAFSVAASAASVAQAGVGSSSSSEWKNSTSSGWSTSIGQNTSTSSGWSSSTTGNVSSTSSTSTGTGASNKLYVGYKSMPKLKYLESGNGISKVTINAFAYNAKSVKVKVGDTTYTATPTNRYYSGGYYYTTLKFTSYVAGITKPTGTISSTSITEFTITVRSRTYTFSSTTFSVAIKSKMTAGVFTPTRSGTYLYSSKKYAAFEQCFAYQGGYSSTNGNSVSFSAAGMTDGTMAIDQLDLYQLYTAKNFSRNTGNSAATGRYTYNASGDCVMA